MQALQTGMTTAASFLGGNIVIQVMTVGLVIAFFVGILSFRAGATIAGGVVAAGIGASISPDFASWLYTSFHGAGAGPILGG